MLRSSNPARRIDTEALKRERQGRSNGNGNVNASRFAADS